MLGELTITIGLVAQSLIIPVFENEENKSTETSKVYIYEEDIKNGTINNELNEELVSSGDYTKFINLSINRLKLGEKFTINTKDAVVIFRKRCPNCKVNGLVFEKNKKDD